MHRGYIKIWKKITEWEWYKDTNTKSLFIHLLIKANYKDTNYRGHKIPRGALVFGRRQCSIDLGLTEMQIRTSLTKLKTTSEITIKTTNKFSIVFINNYDTYAVEKPTDNQQNNQQPNKQVTNKQPTSNQQTTTSIERIEIIERKKEKDISFDLFWEKYPRKENKKKAKLCWQKINKTDHDTIFQKLDYLNTNDWNNKELRFIPHATTWLNGERWKDEDQETTRLSKDDERCLRLWGKA